MAPRFEARKQKILEQLDAPDSEYHDLSPKGSIDAPIRDLISEINSFDGIVTTSSCSGRISVFLEGRKAGSDIPKSSEEDEEPRAGPGGKGGGGAWLFISHDPVEAPAATLSSDFMSKFGLTMATTNTAQEPGVLCRFIHLKFEPMILHILSASVDHAQRILNAAMGAGFRESGAVSLSALKTGEANPVVAVRSTGYSFDSIIGYQDEEGRNISLLEESHLRVLVCIANERFKINTERVARFRTQLLQLYQPTFTSSTRTSTPGWEDADVRKQRKREEGLARQRALQAAGSDQESSTANKSLDVNNVGSIH